MAEVLPCRSRAECNSVTSQSQRLAHLKPCSAAGCVKGAPTRDARREEGNCEVAPFAYDLPTPLLVACRVENNRAVGEQSKGTNKDVHVAMNTHCSCIQLHVHIHLHLHLHIHMHGTAQCAYIFLFWLLNSSLFLVRQTILEG